MRWLCGHSYLLVLILMAIGGAGMASRASAQDLPDHWTPIYEEEGVKFSFIFYRKGDNEHNGVVVRIDNTNRFPVRYRFRMVFRSDTTRVVASPKSGVVAPGEMVTGSSEGLWWIPFTDGREIVEVGMREMKVIRLPRCGDEPC